MFGWGGEGGWLSGAGGFRFRASDFRIIGFRSWAAHGILRVVLLKFSVKVYAGCHTDDPEAP